MLNTSFCLEHHRITCSACAQNWDRAAQEATSYQTIQQEVEITRLEARVYYLEKILEEVLPYVKDLNEGVWLGQAVPANSYCYDLITRALAKE